ncbi:hypothetical protein BVG88_07390 [Serratia marcescens]|uniref:hypothetical protein n=1 Tax=Serratia TaxID=613 RepID=UPI000B616139|nr:MULTISPECIES: hypothetical protein [Serratia]ASM01993.1 hypothetical protein BVG88_07390 [Serratia marcescens]MBH2553800.1 hypothetical protein [Serratia ureilytica]MBH3266274.1 hypothetical protein [Serratia ureilytica]
MVIAKVIINLVLSCLLTLFLQRYITPMPHSDIMTTAGVLSTVAGILFGFVLAAISIFSSSSSSKDGIVHALKQNKILSKILENLLATGATLIFACLFSMIAMFITDNVILYSTRVDFALTTLGLCTLLISILSFSLTWRKINWIIPHM